MGSDFSSFMQQPFVGPVLGMMCFLGIMLVAVVVLLAYTRRRKAAQQQIQTDPVTFDASGHDMPDLDLLVEASPTASTSIPTAPPPQRSVRKGTSMVAVSDGDATEAVEVMTILRDVVDGRLLVQMGDKTLLNVNNDPEFKERFMRIMRELGQVATKPATTPVTSAPQETTPPTIEEESPVPLGSLVPPPPTPPKPKASTPPPPLASGKMPGDLPSFRLEDNPIPERKRGQKVEIKPVQEVNIAGAIEAYLQYKLQHSDYAGRSIHIYPSPDGGVSIEVDGHFYDAVGDISDDAVREFISTAIQEWQERH